MVTKGQELIPLPGTGEALNTRKEKEITMRKVFSRVALAGLGVALAATSASAVGVTVYNGPIDPDNVGPVYIANEALDITNGIAAAALLDVGQDADVGEMVVTTSILNPNSLAFSLSGGDLNAPTQDLYYLHTVEATPRVVTDSNGDPVPGDAVNGTIEFVPTIIGGMKLGDAQTDLPRGTRLRIVTATAPAGTVVTGGLNFSIENGNAHNASYDITVTQGGGATATTTLAVGTNQFVLCPLGGMNETISLDVVPSRTLFEGGDDDAASVNLSDRAASTTCSADISGQFAGFIADTAYGSGSVDSFDLSLISTDQAIDRVDATVFGGPVPYDAGAWTVTYDGDGGIELLDITFTATVTGTDPIVTRSFQWLAVSTPVNDNFLPVTYGPVGAGAWRTEGYEAFIPYIPFGVNGFNAFLKVANTSSDTEGMMSVMADCTEYVNSVAAGTLRNLPVSGDGMIKMSTPGSDLTVGQSEMIEALGLDSGVYHCAVTLMVDVGAEDVFSVAFQTDPVGRTDIPVIESRNFFFPK